MGRRLPVLNGDQAKFECVFPTCGGGCCADGRPSPEAAEAARIEANLAKFLPHLRPAARKRIEKSHFLTNRRKQGKRMMAVETGYCVFFNEGCVLHKVGAEEGDRWRYKPWQCIVFPLERTGEDGNWYVRQWGYDNEPWDLFCLNPKESPKDAMTTLQGEAAFAAALGDDEKWRFAPAPEPTPPAPTPRRRSC